MRARIVGTGMSVPEKRLTNADLEALVDTSDEWIKTRTGISERRMSEKHEKLSDFAVPAVQRALEMSGISGRQVQMVICATVTSDMPFPSTACIVQDRIGAQGAAAFDLSAACTGFIYGLGIAKNAIEVGDVETVVVIGGEMLTKYVDWTDRGTCVLFGDGAGAVVLQAQDDDDHGLLSVAMHSDGSLGELIFRPGGGSLNPPSQETLDAGLNFIKMKGNETFKIAVRRLAAVSDEVLTSCGLAHSDVGWFIPHQANKRIIDAVGQRLEIPEGRTYVNVDRFGNTSAASIPIALDELNRAGRIKDDDIVLCSAFGSGLTWGASVARW